MIEERYYPVGRTCIESVAGVEVCRRFVYDADVRDLVTAVVRSYPKARPQLDREGFRTIARHTIMKDGPENPHNVLTVARFMNLEGADA